MFLVFCESTCRPGGPSRQVGRIEKTPTVGGIIQGDRQVAISNAEIAHAQWPGPPRNGDFRRSRSPSTPSTAVSSASVASAGVSTVVRGVSPDRLTILKTSTN